jgi:hypothetical protein
MKEVAKMMRIHLEGIVAWAGALDQWIFESYRHGSYDAMGVTLSCPTCRL